MFAFLSSRRLTTVFLIAVLIVSSVMFVGIDITRAEAVVISCSGTAGSPTAVTEADLVGDDVTFSDTGGDGYCVLDEAISAVSVIIGTGVVLVHTAEDVDGVTITTTGDLTVTGNVDASGKGCAGGATSGVNGRGPDLSTGICAIDTAGYGDGVPNSGSAYGGGGDHGGLGGSSNQSAGGTTYGSNSMPALLGSGGGAGNGGGTVTGGAGGGLVRLDVGGTLTVSGSILADGGVGGAAVNGGGGGSGGSVYIQAGTIAGVGAVSADGGNGGNSTNTNNEDASGGGGGRIAIYYDTNSSFDLATSLAGKGLKGSGAALASDGNLGTTFILNRKTDDGVGDLRITSGLNLTDGTDFARTNIAIDSGALITCDTQTTLSFTASNNFTDSGSTFTCSSAITTLNISAGATLTTTGVTWTISSTDTINLSAATWTNSGTNAMTFGKDGSTMDWTITNALTLNNFTITGPSGNTTGTANTDVITMNNAVAVSLVSTTIASGVEWTGLTSLNVDASSSINASSRGCSGGVPTGGNGYGPDTSTGVCAVTTSGYGDGVPNSASRYGGGGDHGGAGGASYDGAGGSTYGSSTAPVLLGSGGGSGLTAGGSGGGRIRIDASGTVTISGSLLADGGVGGNSPAGSVTGGGGSGGSIYVTTGTLAGSGTISADGGSGGDSAGANQDGAGGGGGRIAVIYATDNSTFLSGMTALNSVTGGATYGSGGLAGADGTLYTFQSILFSSAVTSVNGTDSTVNRLTITFNQNVDILDGGAGDGLDVITLVASVGTCTIANSDYAASSTTSLVLTVSCTGDAANNTGITINPTYATAGANEIHDTAGSVEMDNARTVTGTDGALPIITTSFTRANGANISRLDLAFSEQVDIVDSGTGADGFDAITLENETSGTCTISNADYSGSNVTTLDLNVSCSTANNTALLFDAQYATAGSSTILDNAGNEMANLETFSSLDRAIPYFISITYKDVTTVDGTVDRVDIVFSETLTGFGYDAADWAFTVPSELTLSDTGASLASTTFANDTVRLTVSADANETGHTTTPKLEYTQTASISIKDAEDNRTETWTPEDVVDGAAPRVRAQVYEDSDSDGVVERVVLTLTEAVATQTAVIGDFAYVANDITGSVLTSGTLSYPTSSTMRLVLGTPGNANITGHTTAPTIAYTDGGATAVADSAGNQLATLGASNLTDSASPIVTARTYQDADANGTVDRVLLTLSEDIVTQTAVIGDFAYVANDITGSVLTSGTLSYPTSSTIRLVLGTAGNANITGHTTAPTIAYTDGGATAAADSAGNQIATFGAASISDGAGAVLVSSSPTDAQLNVLTNSTVVLTFSEPISTGTFAYTCCGAGTDPGRSGAWTSANTVYTITPTVNWTASNLITINITTASDVSTNAFVGAGSSSADPFTFTIVARSSGGTPTPGAGPSVVVTSAMVISPNGGEILIGNDEYQIMWSASGDNLSTMSIYYSKDNGSTYTLIASSELNDGVYLWTVPNETVVTGKVKVSAVTESGGTLVSDASNQSFSISSVAVSDPPVVDEPTQSGPVIAEMSAPDGSVLSMREGSLFRGVELSGVYQVVNGTRYVFPSEDVFLSYYADFSDVVMVSDDQLRKIPFGGRMIMNVGQLIKIQSDNRVYVVQEDGVIAHIPDEATAIATYGADWATLVRDISVVFWFDYTVGE